MQLVQGRIKTFESVQSLIDCMQDISKPFTESISLGEIYVVYKAVAIYLSKVLIKAIPQGIFQHFRKLIEETKRCLCMGTESQT